MTELTIYENKDYDDKFIENLENISPTFFVHRWGDFININGLCIFLEKEEEYNPQLDVYYRKYDTYVKVQINDELYNQLLRGGISWT